MSGLREALIEALAEFDDIGVPWESAEYDYAGAADAVLRVLAEPGDTQQVQRQIADAVFDTTDPDAVYGAVMAVVAPIVAARDAAAERAAYWQRRAEAAWERGDDAALDMFGLRADLAAARQQLEQVRALTPRFCAHDSHGEPIGDAVAINDLLAILDAPKTSTKGQSPPIRPTIPLDAPARPAGHDESGQR